MLAKTRSVLVWSVALAATVSGLGFASCNGGTSTSRPVPVVFGDVIALTDVEVVTIVNRALASIDSPFLHVAVVDRTGQILGVASTASATATPEDNIAVSLARTTGFFSNSQAPLSSRTVETLGTFHFPPTFANVLVPPQAPLAALTAPARQTTGIAGTPQGPLWQINATNRGADVETAATVPPTVFNNVAQFNFAEFFPSRNTDGTFPSPGITLLPGAVPLYKANSTGIARLVGGIGCFVRQDPSATPDFAAAEFAAITGAQGSAPGDQSFFAAISPQGAITIVGILLPYVQQTTRPAGYGPGPAPTVFTIAPAVPGQVDPFSDVNDPTTYLIGPRAARYGANQIDVTVDPTVPALTQVDVEQIIRQCVDSADITRAQIRLPLGSPSKIIATIVDTRGLILAHFRMEDTLCDAVDVVPAKARSVVYYCLPSSLPTSAFANGDTWPGFPTGDPRGIALTTRTLGFLSQPFYPPGIDENPPGPLFALALQNQLPTQLDRWGNAPPDPGYQNGLTFFPGSVPLYKNGQLVGALGVSGDGVEQNDLIAFDGGRGFEPPPELRIDNFSFQGVRLPYVKFPETPR